MQWLDKDNNSISKASRNDDYAKLNTNLLQVAVSNQIIIFDLTALSPEKIKGLEKKLKLSPESKEFKEEIEKRN